MIALNNATDAAGPVGADIGRSVRGGIIGRYAAAITGRSGNARPLSEVR